MPILRPSGDNLNGEGLPLRRLAASHTAKPSAESRKSLTTFSDKSNSCFGPYNSFVLEFSDAYCLCDSTVQGPNYVVLHNRLAPLRTQGHAFDLVILPEHV